MSQSGESLLPDVDAADLGRFRPCARQQCCFCQCCEYACKPRYATAHPCPRRILANLQQRLSPACPVRSNASARSSLRSRQWIELLRLHLPGRVEAASSCPLSDGMPSRRLHDSLWRTINNSAFPGMLPYLLRPNPPPDQRHTRQFCGFR
jgi:hypothetical protein